MNNQSQLTPSQQNLQGVISPQNVRQNNSIQSGFLDNDQITSSFYNTPSNSSITVPGVGVISQSKSSTAISTNVPKYSKTTNQLLLSGLVVVFIVIFFCLVIVFDKYSKHKFL